jgi:YVTN family beta-propeller protein
MKRYFCGLSYLWILLAMPVAASTVRIYVVNTGSETVDVIDPVTNKVVQTINDVDDPYAVDFSPDGSRAYISDRSGHGVNVVDTKTGKTIKRVPLAGQPDHLAVTKDGKRILVSIHNDPPRAAVDVIDTTSLEVVKSIPMKGPMHDVDITPDGKYAVAGSPEGQSMIIIDLQTEQPVWQVKFDKNVQPMAIESGPDGSTSRIFVQFFDFNGFSVVDFARREEVGRIAFPDEPRLPGPFAPGGIFRRLGHGTCHGIGVAPDGKTLWANSTPANSVFVYSLPELKVLGHVDLPELKLPGKAPIGASPNWLTFTPDSKTVYVTSTAPNIVSAIDVKTRKEVARIPVGESPQQISTLVMP